MIVTTTIRYLIRAYILSFTISVLGLMYGLPVGIATLITLRMYEWYLTGRNAIQITASVGNKIYNGAKALLNGIYSKVFQ
jgi:hypothetical protein